MDERGTNLSVQVEGLVALAQTDESSQPQRVSLRFYREEPGGERSIQEVTLSLAQAERLGRFFHWLARRQAQRRRRQLRKPDRGRSNEQRGAS